MNMKKKQPALDRTKICPFLLHVAFEPYIQLYYKENEYHSTIDFDNNAKCLETDEIKIYTWMDATLRELSNF